MKLYLTDATRRMESADIKPRRAGEGEMHQVRVFPHHPQQEIIGFGGAITEAVAYNFSRLSDRQKASFLELYFTPGGSNYSMCRLPIQSCDFSFGQYAYVTDPHDESLDTFTIARDRIYLIPLIKRIQALRPDLEFIASPWSPPAFMKTTRRMRYGGKLNARYAQRWAELVARYLLAYRQEGIKIGRITVQNEPHAVQVWESCIYDAQAERDFAVGYLRPTLDAHGLDEVRILGWDHNKERLLERGEALFDDDMARRSIDGLGFHFYSGDHFAQVREARRIWPDKELILTEGCGAYSNFDGQMTHDTAEQYAHDWIGNLAAGANACLDWNLLLDGFGGPTYVENWCDAPMMYDESSGKLRLNRSHSYLGHITRFIAPGAHAVTCSSYSSRLECLAAVNPDGSHVLVALNRSHHEVAFELVEGGMLAPLAAPPRSMMTVVW